MAERKSINVEVGQRIKASREKRGLTQEQLSELLALTPHFLSSVERGVTGISLEKLRQLCLVLNVSSDFLLFGTVEGKYSRFCHLSGQEMEILDRIMNDCLHLLAASKETHK